MIRIAVVGSLNLDLVVKVDRLAVAGETLSGSDLALFEGGKGANQACAASRLGARVAMIGQIGDDVFGPRLVSALAERGVDTSGIGRCPRATGTALISVMPNGENSIVISPGANATLHADLVTERMAAFPSLTCTLFQLETPLGGVEAGLLQARRRGITTILDPAPFQPLPEALRGAVDFITPNQSEALALAGNPSETLTTWADAARIARRLRVLGFGGVIIKMGELGCHIDCPAVRANVGGFPVHAVDTTAAGDTFNAAFAVALTEGAGALEAARFANAAAAISVTRPGAQASVPARFEVDEFLRANPALGSATCLP